MLDDDYKSIIFPPGKKEEEEDKDLAGAEAEPLPSGMLVPEAWLRGNSQLQAHKFLRE